MKCVFCGYKEDKVIDSRLSSGGEAIRRRRECLKCSRRFTTYEYIQQVPLVVVKRDGRREPFDRQKILSGIIKACEKRPVSMNKIEEIVSSIEQLIHKKFDKEIKTQEVGEMVMVRLLKLDDVAYVRFASVYRQFKDVNQFMQELKLVMKKEK